MTTAFKNPWIYLKKYWDMLLACYNDVNDLLSQLFKFFILLILYFFEMLDCKFHEMGLAGRWYAQKVCESVEGDVIRIWSDCKCANTNLEIYLSNVDLVLINKLFTYLSMHATYILSVHIILVLPKVQAQHIFVKYFATTVFKICHAHTMRHVDLMKSVFYLPMFSSLK